MALLIVFLVWTLWGWLLAAYLTAAGLEVAGIAIVVREIRADRERAALLLAYRRPRVTIPRARMPEWHIFGGR